MLAVRTTVTGDEMLAIVGVFIVAVVLAFFAGCYIARRRR